MTDNMKKFLEEASKNPKMQEKLIQANRDYFQAVIDAAKEQGIALTNEDIALLMKADKNHDGQISKDELASLKNKDSQKDGLIEDELAAVAGGAYFSSVEGKPASNCSCITFGDGTPDEYQELCTCTFKNGQGQLTEYGKKEAAAGHIANVGIESNHFAYYCLYQGGNDDSNWNKE